VGVMTCSFIVSEFESSGDAVVTVVTAAFAAVGNGGNADRRRRIFLKNTNDFFTITPQRIPQF
jgi:hypothetical protein